jgi:stage II sporulation protein AA (anti-sigma F factor antagonist)
MSDVKLSHQTVQESPKVVVLKIVGEADEGHGRRIEHHFDDLMKKEQPRHILLDLAELTFAGSSFFSSLLFWRESLAHQGGKLLLVSVRPEVASTLRMVSLDRFLPMYPDPQTALAALPKS